MRHARADLVILLAVSLAAVAGCAPPSNAREYELRGQVLAVDPVRQELTIKHEDIPRFMPGMTMPFKVRDRALLEGRAAGDLITATLVVEDNDAYLRTVTRTGSAPLTEPPPRARTDVMSPGDAPPDVELIDGSGRPRRLGDFRGQAVAVTFVYTRCPLPNFCPLMDRHFQDVQREIAGDAGLRGRVRLLSVSIDPDFDRPPVLAARARALGADPATWSFLTGDRAAIDRFAGAFGVSVARDDPKQQEILHNLRTAVVGGDGRLVTVFNGNEWTPRQLIDELRKAVAAR